MHKTKRLTLIITLCIAAMLLVGCAAHNSTRDTELPTLTIGSDDFRPYIYLDVDDAYAGIDVDLAREACRRMGYEAVFEQINWDEKDDLLASGDIDCIWGCFQMDDQESDYQWVGPYMTSYQLIAVLADSDIYTISDLEGKSVAVVSGSLPERIFTERTDAWIPELKSLYCLVSMDEAVIALRNEYVDAITGHDATLHAFLTNADVEYRLLDEELGKVNLGAAFSKDADPEVCSRLSAALDEMKTDGTIATILNSYGLDADCALGEG